MNLTRLKWATILLPIAFIFCLSLATTTILEPKLGTVEGHWVSIVFTAATVVLFSTIVFSVLERMQRRIVRQNEELSALNSVSRALGGTLELEEAITRALDRVMDVTGAAAGEIVVDGHSPDEEPIRFSVGTPGQLRQIDDLFARDADRPRASTRRAGDEVEIIDVTASPTPVNERSPAAVQTFASLPLRAQNKHIGFLRLLAGEASYLTTESSERLLTALGSQIAMAIQSSRLFADVVNRGKEAQALYEIGLEIASLQDLQKILQSVVEQAKDLLHGETAALCLSRGNGGLTIAGSAGPPEAFRRTPVPFSPLSLPVIEAGGVSGRLPYSGKNCPVLTDEYCARHLSVPLLVGTTTIGELCVSSRTPFAHDERDRALLSALADMAAIAINNARLLESERHVAVLEERERLSREMHDSLAQVLGYLQLKAQATRRTLSRKDVARVDEELEDMASIASEAYQDVREAILGLRETVSPGVGIVGTLGEYLQKFSRQAGIRADLEVEDGMTPRFSPDIEVQLVRVVQEALTNVRKHAGAQRAWIRFGRTASEWTITIEDNGKGFDPALAGSGGQQFGVRTMRERVERVGGRFEIDSKAGHGTRVRIYFSSSEGDVHDPDQDPPGGRPAPLPEGSARPAGGAGRHGGGGRGF